MATDPHVNGNGNIASALVAAQTKMRHAKIDRVNPHFGNRYATLAAVLDACRELLNAEGIAVVQRVTSDPDKGTVSVSTVLHHRSGEALDCGALTLKATQNNPQQIGSALTYARRYSLAAAVGIASEEDDDGECAEGRQTQPAATPTAPAAPRSVPRATVVAPPSPLAAVRPTAPSTPAPTTTTLPGGSTVRTKGGPAPAPTGGPSPGAPRFPADARDKKITKPQASRLWAIAQGWLDSGGVEKDRREGAIKVWLADLCGVEHTADLTWRQYKALGLDDDSGRDDLLRAAAFAEGPAQQPPAPEEPPPPSDDELPMEEEPPPF